MDFVIPGPGARDGLRKCFADTGGLSDAELIRLMADRQEQECARLGLEFPSLWGRPLQLIDCQNLFRSEEHTSELQSLMRISYAVFCLKKKKKHTHVTLLYTMR